MFDKNFSPPKERIAITATKKRVDIIESIINTLAKCSSSILLTGSMAYGQDFSVTPESDIDLQLTITADLLDELASCKFFQKYNIERIKAGFLEGKFQQFSLNFIYKEIPVECHFWEEKTLKDILLYKTESVVRLRSQTKKIATDYSHSFDGEEHIMEYPDYKEGVYNLGKFPAYQVKNKKIFLSRPITNILGNAIVLFDACEITETMDQCRELTEEKISEMKQENGKTYSIFNTMPGKNKISEEVKIMLI
ncbi:hypothetical protein KA057_00580 [Candidatus Gracilibacteria bacterium]|nr:hypothetical protein [Candidatus Gracilibacteria bacterium]